MAESIATIKGELIAKGQRFAILVSRFNEFISSRLLNGAVDTLERHGCRTGDITAIWVPGAWELAATAKRAALSVRMNVCVGTSTLPPRWPHFFSDANWSSK